MGRSTVRPSTSYKPEIFLFLCTACVQYSSVTDMGKKIGLPSDSQRTCRETVILLDSHLIIAMTSSWRFIRRCASGPAVVVACWPNPWFVEAT